MSLPESTESPVTWPLWASALVLGLIIVFLAPHNLVAQDNRTAPAASVSGNTSLAQSDGRPDPGWSHSRQWRPDWGGGSQSISQDPARGSDPGLFWPDDHRRILE